MVEYVIVGALAGGTVSVAVVLIRRALQNNAAKKAARAEFAHSEPGGPRRGGDPGASGLSSARQAELRREGGHS